MTRRDSKDDVDDEEKKKRRRGSESRIRADQRQSNQSGYRTIQPINRHPARNGIKKERSSQERMILSDNKRDQSIKLNINTRYRVGYPFRGVSTWTYI